MKKITFFALAATVLIGLTLSHTSYAQIDPTGNPQNRGIVKPNFIDEDGDGLCDNNTGGIGTGEMLRDGQGQGQGSKGSGNGSGSGNHQQLRDGSCEDGGTPVAAPTGTSGRQGKGRAAAPNK